jgi:hypothetical protein
VMLGGVAIERVEELVELKPEADVVRKPEEPGDSGQVEEEVEPLVKVGEASNFVPDQEIVVTSTLEEAIERVLLKREAAGKRDSIGEVEQSSKGHANEIDTPSVKKRRSRKPRKKKSPESEGESGKSSEVDKSVESVKLKTGVGVPTRSLHIEKGEAPEQLKGERKAPLKGRRRPRKGRIKSLLLNETSGLEDDGWNCDDEIEKALLLDRERRMKSAVSVKETKAEKVDERVAGVPSDKHIAEALPKAYESRSGMGSQL